MKVIAAASLITVGLLWLAILLQNMMLFFSTLIVFLSLISLNQNWKEAIDKIQLSLILCKLFLLKHLKEGNHSKIIRSKNNRILLPIRPILQNKKILAIQNKINCKIDQEIRRTGKAHNARILAQQSIAYMIFTFFAIIPISIVLGIFISPMLLLFLLVCPIWLFYPKLKLRLLASERKSSIEDEMAFFTLYASVMQSTGQSLYHSIVDVSVTNIFPSIRNDGMMLSRNTQVFGMDSITALNDHGYSHPNSFFGNFLLGYVSISKSGGNLALYMERKAEEFFQKTQFKYKNYRSQAHLIGETMLILLTILPTLILISSFLLAKDSISIVMVLSLVFVPIVTIFIILSINQSQPKIKNLIEFDVRSIYLASIAVVISLIFYQQAWFVIAIGVAVGASANFCICLGRFREIGLIESVLADFFRDITEFRKIGIAIPNAIIKISEERYYNKYFDGLLLSISAQLRHGTILADILDGMMIRSWVAKTSFFVLGKVSESGGGTPEVFEQVTNFLTKINQTKRETQSSISSISYFATASPVMMSYITNEMISILEKLNHNIEHMYQNMFNIDSLLASDELIGAINLLNVISSISLGLVMSKLTHFSMKHTLFLGIMVLVSILSIILLPFFPSLVKI